MSVTRTFTWDGLNARDVTARLGLTNVWMYAEVESTQDIAHEQAAKGVPAGALVVADAQRSGRGRQGRSWASQPGQGVWCTLVERPRHSAAFQVLSLRIGMRLADALDAMAGERIQLKWPNDLLLNDGKLAGILPEARWSGATLEWVAIGVGVNVTPPGIEGAASLRPGVERIDVLRAVVEAVRGAAASRGTLTASELQRFAERDWLAGQRILSPATGVVEGIDATGALLVREGNAVTAHRSGTIQLENGA
jgi:BirA family transcriptional regulator, biotin operon repressor / biotin---[acetyl-CoA-carboxylase] ligase